MQQLAEQNYLQPIIEQIWERRHQITPDTVGTERETIEAVIAELDAGRLRVAEPVKQGVWKVNPWIKQALLLSFRLFDTVEMPPQGSGWFDKVALKFTHWRGEDFRAAGIRTVPGSVVRRSAFIDQSVVLMPSFVNIGAHVGAGTMIDTWATVGSCAQIGRDCHISGGAGIGGVIEPLQADRSSLRMVVLSGRGPRSPKVSSLSAVRCWPWVCIWAHRRASSIAAAARFTWGGSRPIRLLCRARGRGQRYPMGHLGHRYTAPLS